MCMSLKKIDNTGKIKLEVIPIPLPHTPTHRPHCHSNRRYDRSRQAWIINYDAIQTGAGILNGLIANTRDELRLVRLGP